MVTVGINYHHTTGGRIMKQFIINSLDKLSEEDLRLVAVVIMELRKEATK